MVHVRLGDILVDRGAISRDQRDLILTKQQHTLRPFGALAEEIFGVSPSIVEDAWAAQYSAGASHRDPRTLEVPDHVRAQISRRQAWQFGMIPIAETPDGLELVTSQSSLPRALRFAGWRIPNSCFFSICADDVLPLALEIHYPIGGMDAQFIARVMTQFARAG